MAINCIGTLFFEQGLHYCTVSDFVKRLSQIQLSHMRPEMPTLLQVLLPLQSQRQPPQADDHARSQLGVSSFAKVGERPSTDDPTTCENDTNLKFGRMADKDLVSSFFGINVAVMTVQLAAKDKERNISWMAAAMLSNSLSGICLSISAVNPSGELFPRCNRFRARSKLGKSLTKTSEPAGRECHLRIRDWRTGHSRAASSRLSNSKIVTVVRCQLFGRRVIPKETKPLDATTLTLPRWGTSRRARFLGSTELHDPACVSSVFGILHDLPDDASLGPSVVDEAGANLEDCPENPPSVQLEGDTPGRSEATDQRQTKDQTNPQRTH